MNISTQRPAVDVVIPTRDRPELLRTAIEGALTQTYGGPIRVIVVFDQSAPDPSLARSDPNRSVTVISNTRSPGLAGSRNSGLVEATADLVAFCDDDDRWIPEKLDAQVNLLQANPDTSIVACGVRITFGDTTTERRVSDQLGDRPVLLDDLLRDRLTELHPSTFLINRHRLMTEIGLVEEAIPGSYAEDYDFLLRAARVGPVRATNLIGVEVLWHQRSYFTSRWDTIVTALIWLLERYPEFDRVPAGKARITGQLAFASAASGNRREAARWARTTLRRNPREGRAYLALAVASRALSADRVVRELNSRGRGI